MPGFTERRLLQYPPLFGVACSYLSQRPSFVTIEELNESLPGSLEMLLAYFGGVEMS
jgi:hypothetical protein